MPPAEAGASSEPTGATLPTLPAGFFAHCVAWQADSARAIDDDDSCREVIGRGVAQTHHH
jgi:hypothetical protein